jgi:tRNA (adenine22-N1)-methyltransferase
MIATGSAPARLGPRLRHLLELCPEEYPVADVGSGHGRLALELALRRPGATVYATEARPGPARELRRLLGPGSPVLVLEGPGLEPLQGLSCRGAVIAGMGGHTIRGILQTSPALARGLDWLCLQPMQDWEPLWSWVTASGWWELQTATCWERSRTYRTLLLRPR